MLQQLTRVAESAPVAVLENFETCDDQDDDQLSFLLDNDNNSIENPDEYEDEADEDDLKNTVMAAAIQNPLVVKEILTNLPPRDLLACRLVSSCWNELGTKILKLGSPPPAVTFWLSLCSAQYDRYTKNGTRTLKIFNKILKSSFTLPYELPFVSFNLNNVSLPGSDSDLQEFFSLYGTKVKALRMSLVNTEVTTFAKLLRDGVPNLESLHIEKFPPEWEKNESLSLQVFNNLSKRMEKICLPKLKCFKFDGRLSNYPQIVREILKAAVNLKNFNSIIRGSDIHHLTKIFEETGRLHTIKNLQFEPTAVNLEFYENFINFQNPHSSSPKLTKCLFSLRSLNRQPNCWPQAGEIMSKILQNGAPTLQEIGLVYPMPLTFSKLVEWRRMERVRKIEISIFTTGGILESDDENLKNLPRQQSSKYLWSKIFPNLNCLALVPIVNRDHFWDRHIPFKGPAQSVTRLEVHFPSPEFCLENLHKIFPNVSHLVMKRVTDFPRLGLAVWKLKKLKTIELQLDIDFQSGNGNVYPAIDAIFTGFSQETCKKLKYSKGLEEDSEIVENLRVNPSLLDLQCLENLTIELCYWTPFTSSSRRSVQDSYNLMTNVTGIYAFHSMPQLTVNVTATSLFCEQNLRHIKQSLASIAPFVNKLETSSIKPAAKPMPSNIHLRRVNEFFSKIWQFITSQDGHFVKFLVILMVACVLKLIL